MRRVSPLRRGPWLLAAEGEPLAMLTALREVARWGLAVSGDVPQAPPLPECAVG